MLTPDSLSQLYDCATTSERLPGHFADNQRDLSKVIRYGEIFKMCQSNYSTEYIQKAEDLTDDEKKLLIKVVTKKLVINSTIQEEIPWNVNIVIGNSHVAKSLRPVINIQMPTIEGEHFEFDIDSFAKFRKQLAEVVLAVNPQE